MFQCRAAGLLSPLSIMTTPTTSIASNSRMLSWSKLSSFSMIVDVPPFSLLSVSSLVLYVLCAHSSLQVYVGNVCCWLLISLFPGPRSINTEKILVYSVLRIRKSFFSQYMSLSVFTKATLLTCSGGVRRGFILTNDSFRQVLPENALL